MELNQRWLALRCVQILQPKVKANTPNVARDIHQSIWNPLLAHLAITQRPSSVRNSVTHSVNLFVLRATPLKVKLLMVRSRHFTYWSWSLVWFDTLLNTNLQIFQKRSNFCIAWLLFWFQMKRKLWLFYKYWIYKYMHFINSKIHEHVCWNMFINNNVNRKSFFVDP